MRPARLCRFRHVATWTLRVRNSSTLEEAQASLIDEATEVSSSLKAYHEVRPTISIVIATRGRPDSLRQCLESILECNCAPHEIIVVDSASRDPHASERVAKASGAAFIQTKFPGAAYARNLGALAASGDIVAFTDDDCLVDANWIEALMEGFRSDSIDASVGPIILKGSDPPVAMGVAANFQPLTDAVRFCRTDADWFNRLAFGSVGFGANLAVRRSSFLQFGMFRACLGAGAPIPGDENYYLVCVVSRGGIVCNFPYARVTHPVQLKSRVQELNQGGLAYVLFLLFTQPHLWRGITSRMFRRVARTRNQVGKDANFRAEHRRFSDVTRMVLKTPSLLLSAWQVSRSLPKISPPNSP